MPLKKVYTLHEINDLYTTIQYLAQTGKGAAVIVKLLDTDPTSKTQRCSVKIADKGSRHPIERDLVVTLPTRSLIEKRGLFYAPIDLFEKKLSKREYLVGVSTPGYAAIIASIQSAVSQMVIKDRQEYLKKVAAGETIDKDEFDVDLSPDKESELLTSGKIS